MVIGNIVTIDILFLFQNQQWTYDEDRICINKLIVDNS